MTLLNDADKIYIGSAEADAVYVGETQVWPAAAFNPDDIAGLAVWHDASQLPLADGANVTTWPNLGTANAATIVGTPPTYKAGAANGHGVVRFSAVGGGLRGNNASIYSTSPIGPGWPLRYNWTMIYVARRWGANGGRCFTAPYPEGSNCLIGFHTASYDCMHDTGGWLKVGPPYPATPPDPWRMYGADNQGTVGVRFFINGVDVISGPIAVAGDLNYYYNINGYQLAGGGEIGDFDVAELIMYDRRLSDAERISVEGYLRTKWGLP